MNQRQGLMMVVVSALLACPAAGVTRGDSLRIFPAVHLLGDLPADGSSHRFSALQLFHPKEVAVGVGAVVPLVSHVVGGTAVQLSAGASVQARLDPGQSIAVQSTEFAVDFLLVDMSLSADLFLRLGLGHTSHHAGDGLLKKDSLFRALDVSRDYVRWMVVHTFQNEAGCAYLGINYAYHLIIDEPVEKPLIVQTGFALELWSLTREISLYAAGDVKFRQELAFGSTQRYESGVEYRGMNKRRVRVALTGEFGFDERGQYPGVKQREIGLGLVVVL